MRLTKKGDLALSTNAIVVLIIAVIILGLIITFVTGSFSKVNKQFFGQVSALPAPPPPSSSSPITLSDVLIASAGEQVGMKISVMNVGTGDLTAFKPVVDCTKAGLLTEDPDSALVGQDINVRDTATYTYYATVDKAAAKKMYRCQVTAVFTGVTKVTDFTLNIQ